MNPKLLRLILIVALAVGVVIVSAILPAGSRRSSDQILAEIAAIEVPGSEKAEVDESGMGLADRPEAKARMAEKARLIGELFAIAPDNPELPELLPVRWRSRMGTPEGEAETKAEIAAILARDDRPRLVAEAAYVQTWMTIGKLGRNRRSEDLIPVVREFTRRVPRDPRGAQLLVWASSGLEDPQRKAQILQDVEHDYPDSPTVRAIVSVRRQAAGLGHPIDLDFNDATTHKPVSIKALKGKVVVIDFWATWCGPCTEDLPHLKRVYAEYHPRGVEFVGVSLDGPRDQGGLDKLKAFVARNEIPWPQFYQGNGWDSPFSLSWGVESIPTLFVVDAGGNLASTDAGNDLENLLDKLLAPIDKPTAPRP